MSRYELVFESVELPSDRFGFVDEDFDSEDFDNLFDELRDKYSRRLNDLND